jgi:hypothetical protein
LLSLGNTLAGDLCPFEMVIDNSEERFCRLG